ncbi:MAG: YihY/virulence factor BrkB family protein [Gemmatimonadaceae bacterium]
MTISPKGTFGTLRDTFNEFMKDDCPSTAAALSYYTAFSLPPFLILILVLLSTVISPGDVRGSIESQIDTFMGPAGGAQIRQFLESAQPPEGDGMLTTIIGLVTLAFGATGFFLSLQSALNKAWEVAPDPDQGGIRQFVIKRLFSFGMILGVAFLLLVSLALTALISAFSARLRQLLPGGGGPILLELLNLAISFPIVALLFALMFRTIPDAHVNWRNVRTGAVVTAVLFLAGKTVLGLYIGRSNPGEPYGAAGALAVMLLWIYYSAMILLFGAELTQVVARNHGEQIIPERGAVRVIVDHRKVRSHRHRHDRSSAPTERDTPTRQVAGAATDADHDKSSR